MAAFGSCLRPGGRARRAGGRGRSRGSGSRPARGICSTLISVLGFAVFSGGFAFLRIGRVRASASGSSAPEVGMVARRGTSGSRRIAAGLAPGSPRTAGAARRARRAPACRRRVCRGSAARAAAGRRAPRAHSRIGSFQGCIRTSGSARRPPDLRLSRGGVDQPDRAGSSRAREIALRTRSKKARSSALEAVERLAGVGEAPAAPRSGSRTRACDAGRAGMRGGAQPLDELERARLCRRPGRRTSRR